MAKANVGAEARASNSDGDQGAVEPNTLQFTRKGIKSGEDFANLMSALMSDVLEGRVNPQVANAAVNAGGKLLKVVEMQYKYGQTPESKQPMLVLAKGEPS